MIGNVSNCPLGHRAVFLDGAYSIQEGILHLRGSDIVAFRRITEIVSGVAKDEIDPKAAQDEISILSPELSALISAAAGNNLSLKTILIWISICITAITGGTAIAANFVENIRTIFGESSPTPDTVINNDITIINKIAARDERRRSVSNSLTREQIRKQKQMAKKKMKGENKKSKKLRREQTRDK